MRPSLPRLALLAIFFFGLIYGFFHFYLPPASLFYQITPAPTITPPDSTKQAKTIVIPKDLPTTTPSETPVIVTPTPEPIIYYTVQSGDSLSTIANKYNLSIQDLVTANYLSDPNYIEAGQVLLIDTKPITEPRPMATGKQIIIILSKQTVYAYENDQLIKKFLVSSGTDNYPTVIGNYKIDRKYPTDDMSGPGYYIKDVPWVMYFHKGYSFHGTTWHDNFGTPMSHGCLNMTVADAKWLYNWADIGTIVQVVP